MVLLQYTKTTQSRQPQHSSPTLSWPWRTGGKGNPPWEELHAEYQVVYFAGETCLEIQLYTELIMWLIIWLECQGLGRNMIGKLQIRKFRKWYVDKSFVGTECEDCVACECLPQVDPSRGNINQVGRMSFWGQHSALPNALCHNHVLPITIPTSCCRWPQLRNIPELGWRLCRCLAI